MTQYNKLKTYNLNNYGHEATLSEPHTPYTGPPHAYIYTMKEQEIKIQRDISVKP